MEESNKMLDEKIKELTQVLSKTVQKFGFAIQNQKTKQGEVI
jgi:hypothetical protein